MYSSNLEKYIDEVSSKKYISFYTCSGTCRPCTLKLIKIADYYRILKAPTIAAENNCLVCLEKLFNTSLKCYNKLTNDNLLNVLTTDYQPVIITSGLHGSYDCLKFLLDKIQLHEQLIKELKYVVKKNGNINCLKLIEYL